MPFGPKTNHPTFGMIGASRVTCGPGGLYAFGSRIKHSAFIDITIRRASHKRDLNQDWFYGEDELVRVRLTEAQWATFVSSLNVGFGVPCTLCDVMRERQGEVPKPEDSIAQAKNEARKNAEDTMDLLSHILQRLEYAIQNPKKRELSELARDLKIAIGNYPANHAYLYSSFEKHVENVVTDAKASVEAHYMAVATRAQLVEGYAPPKMIEETGEKA